MKLIQVAIYFIISHFLVESNNDFMLCKKTNNVVNLKHNCSSHKNLLDKIQCISTFNVFEDFRDENDEFHRVKLLKKPLVVYSNDGRIYETKCEQVENVELPNSVVVKNCTRDLPIVFSNKGIRCSFFLKF